jgi:large conductance mechanosensitive channel
MGMLKEFREFAMRGNVIDMAVGVVIGAAFGKIVSSLVGDVIMPLIGKLAGSGDFKDQFIWLSDKPRPATLAEALKSGEPLIGWGSFLQTVIDFTIIAFAIFLAIKALNAAKARFERERTETPPAAPPEEIVLLREIRDQLARR